jgi:uncharacterized membrane protein YqjE
LSDQNQKQPDGAPLGQSISEIIDRTTTIVHEEIELAKAELAVSLQNLLRGSVAGIVGGVFAFFGLFILLIGISFFISDLIDYGFWTGFLIVAFFLFLFGGILAWFALKKIKKGSQLVPTQAIAEAKATQAALQPDPPAQQFDAVAVEETVASADASPIDLKPSDVKPATEPAQDPKAAEAADLLAAAKEVVEQPAQPEAPPTADPPPPTFVTERTDLPYGETEKSAKAAAKAEAKAAKEAAKAQAQAEKDSAKAMKAAEKEAAKAKKAADKAVKKAGGTVEPPSDNNENGES